MVNGLLQLSHTFSVHHFMLVWISHILRAHVNIFIYLFILTQLEFFYCKNVNVQYSNKGQSGELGYYYVLWTKLLLDQLSFCTSSVCCCVARIWFTHHWWRKWWCSAAACSGLRFAFSCIFNHVFLSLSISCSQFFW